MKPFCARAAALLLLLLLGSCGVRDRVYNPAHFRATGVLVPPEILLPQPLPARDAVVDGVHVAKAGGDYMAICCWISDRARFRVAKHSAAKSLSITAYVPDMPAFKKGQRLVVLFPEFHASKAVTLATGFNTLVIPLPKAAWKRDRSILVELDSAVSFTQFGQTHAMVLTSAYFE